MTLYSALAEVNTPDMNIQTAEDPIEYTLPGLNQMQMNRQIGLTFARALRCYLRMDPDVILVGEIRDEETAGIAAEAALTGHLLVSTLHTNDAPSTVTRLSEMGIEPFNISASLVGVCAQRLLRRVCKNCKMAYEPEGREKQIMEKAIGWSGQVFKANPQGCPVCNVAGLQGPGRHPRAHGEFRVAHGGDQQGGRGRRTEAHRHEDGDEDASPGFDTQGQDGADDGRGGPGERAPGSDPLTRPGAPMAQALPYRIAVLVFLENAAAEHLLLHRAKAPNKGAWSPIGGKLEMAIGESPFECAVRETREETGFGIAAADLHLFAIDRREGLRG